MHLYSAAKAIIRKFHQQNQVKPSPLVLTLLGSNYQQSGKRNDIPEEIFKLGGEAMIPYLARWLDITMNNNAIPCDWKKYLVVPIYKGGDRSVVRKYRQVSLTSVFLKANGTGYSRVPKRSL
jgi:hypothetical protein